MCADCTVLENLKCLLDITDNNGEDFAEANQDGELSSDDDMEDIVCIVSNAYYLQSVYYMYMYVM